MTTLTANLRIAPPGDAVDSASASASVARLRGVSKRLGGRRVLQDINLELQPACWLAIHGGNGAGKSTLLRLLASLTPPTSGIIELFGRRADRDLAAVRARIGFIGHQLMLYRDLTVLENLAFFAHLYRIENPRSRIEELVRLFGLASRALEPVKNLSRGTAQRVAIARALLHKPALILADEPFTGLDAESGQVLVRHFSGLRSQGTAIVMAHHDLRGSAALADRVVVLRDGQITLDTAAASPEVRGLAAGLEAGA